MKQKPSTSPLDLIQLRKNIKAATPFVLVCGIVALLYFLYRTVLLAVPVVSLQQQVVHPHGDASIVCGQEEGDAKKDPAPVYSASYQKRLQSAPALSDNMIQNANLEAINGETEQPDGYSHTLENDKTTYESLQDEDGTKFLRVTSVVNSAIMPAWQSDPVSIAAKYSYAYTFWYRSSSPVDVTIVTTRSDGLDYTYVVTLPAVSAWTQFTGEHTNEDAAKKFQVIISGTEKGSVDTRSYDLHRIPDANLPKGVISVTFDDGWDSTYQKALPILEKYSIPTTQYIIADVAAHNVYEYMNFNEIKKLHDKGHEIGSHSLTHCDQVVLDAKSLEDNALRSKTLLEEQVGPVTTFAYPLGQYNELTQTTYEKHYPLIRTSDVGYNDRYYDETNIHSMAVLHSTTDKEFMSWIIYAKTHGLWLVLSYHRVDASGVYNVTGATLDAQMAQVRASGLTVLPLSKAAATVRPQ